MEIAEVNSSHSQSVQGTELIWSGSIWRMVELGGGAQSRPAAGVGAGCLWENNSQPFVWPGSTQCRDGVGRMGGEHRVGTGPEGRAGAGGGESLGEC